MFKFIKKITGPIVFAKGVAQFRQHQHKIAKQLFTKAVQWMPSLQSDPLYLALAHLCDHHLGTNQDGCTETLQHC